MFKDCKCGRSIPREWTRCGECTEKRSVVDMHQRMEGSSYRKKVRIRSALARLRGEATAKVAPTPEQEVLKETQESALLVVQRLRETRQRKLRTQFTHDNLAPALKAWMEDD